MKTPTGADEEKCIGREKEKPPEQIFDSMKLLLLYEKTSRQLKTAR